MSKSNAGFLRKSAVVRSAARRSVEESGETSLRLSAEEAKEEIRREKEKDDNVRISEEVQVVEQHAAKNTNTVIPVKKKKKKIRMVEASLHVQTNLRTLRPKALAIADHLEKLYPSPEIPLHHASPFQLLCAVVLSAQTTDKKVNECTVELFRLAPDADSMARLDVQTIQSCIKSLGLAPTKARYLSKLSRELIERHGGNVPDTFEELEELPGVGHKTASVVMAQVHGREAFPVDTHIHRLAQRWGLTSGKSVEQTEADLKLLFPSQSWRDLHLQIIYFGREKCPAESHDPIMCPICSWAAVPPYDKPGASSPRKAGERRPKGKTEATKRDRSDDNVDSKISKKGRGKDGKE